MPDLKISELDEMTESPAKGDYVPIVDVSDPASPTGKTKKIKVERLVSADEAMALAIALG